MNAFDVLGSAPARVLRVLAASLVASCHTAVGLDDFDRTLRTTDAQTIVVAKDHTLYAPFEIVGARGYVTMVAEEVDAVSKLFGFDLASPLPIWLRPVRGMKGRIEIRGNRVTMLPAGEPPHHGVAGYANGTAVVLYVEEEVLSQGPDGRTIRGTYEASAYRSTLRHELAHVWTRRAGIAGASWFDEGLAEYVESLKLEDGRLVPDGVSELLGRAAKLPRERCTIRRVLDWRENGMRIHEGLEPADLDARVASGAFVHFMMSHVEGDSFVARARGLRSLSDAELLAHEDHWQAWRASRAPAAE